MTVTTEEHLITGWEPDLPLDDSILRHALFCWAAVSEAFALATGGRTKKLPAFAASDYRRPSGLFNSAVLLQPPDTATFSQILEEVEAFFSGGTGEALLWSAWPLPDLRHRGWQLYGHPPLMIRPPAELHRPPADPPVSVEEVADAAGLADWERVAIEGYPLPELLPVVPGSFADPTVLRDGRLRFTIGKDGDEPVSIGSLFVESGLGFFVLAVTRPSVRRRGHWLAHSLARLRAAPDAWMAGLFSDDSQGPARRLGFVPVFRLTLWGLPRPS